MVEQHIRNVWVGGSTPFIGSIKEYMPYLRSDPQFKSVLGTPRCPKGCGHGLAWEVITGVYYCEVCDKEVMEKFFKEAKEKRKLCTHSPTG